MNKNIVYVILAVLVLLGLVWFLTKDRPETVINTDNMPVATTTEVNSTTTASTESTSTSAQTNTGVKGVAGYPASWPADIPKYPNGIVSEKAGNNPASAPTEAAVVFTTKDSVKTVVSFYLKGLVANGWKITEDGAGTADMVTIRATKGKRSVGGYVHKETNGRTEATIGVNIGL